MRPMVVLLLFGIAVASCGTAEARGLGRFASGMARGAISNSAHAGVRSYVAKNYTLDVLTVDQLVACLKRANSLDEESEELETSRVAVQIASKELDELGARIEQRGLTVDTRVKRQVDGFNADIEVYNATVQSHKARQAAFNKQVDLHNVGAALFNGNCAKKYYADDMENARKLAGL
ncbi:MAG: hypothetical protein NTV56_00355 [Alphaproteobacteria bacterium]|nr:hypothetical protein [Alphaproteobacteria bacterium]